MNDAKIPGGYIFLSRKIIESTIWEKPPLYIKVWIYLLTKAQHTEYKQLKRGQLRTSLLEIQKACGWKVGYRKEYPSYKEVRDVIDWLRSPCGGNTTGTMAGNMIGTTKGTHGILINIENYCFYQDSNNYDGQDGGQTTGTMAEERRAGQGHNINKNDKNEQECKDNNMSLDMTPYSQIKDLFNNICVTLPKIKDITDNRQKTVKARWKKYNNIDFFKEIFEKVNKSDFLSGRNEKWNGCCFDWIMKPSNLQKIIEGNYDNKNSNQTDDEWRM